MPVVQKIRHFPNGGGGQASWRQICVSDDHMSKTLDKWEKRTYILL